MYDNICCYCLYNTEGQYPCPSCGTPQEFRNDDPAALPPRTVLFDNYLLGRCLGSGGFGITYLGLDLQLNIRVAIKEYLPKQIAIREKDGTTVRPTTQNQKDDFEYGLGKFSDEARTLAQFNHPSIVPVSLFFKANNTAYFVMRYLKGQTLEQALKNHQGGFTEQETLAVFAPILDGLKEVHSKGVLHRDLKPQNIYLPESGVPVLLDFGSARQYMVNKNRNFSVFLTPGYAPFEQYTTNSVQGPYTDIYACAATMYSCLRGYNHAKGRIDPPISAPDRQGGERLLHVKEMATHSISDRLANAIMLGMECEPQRRPQSISAFQEMLPFSMPPEIETKSKGFELLGIAGQYSGQRFPLSMRPITLGKDPSKCAIVFEHGMISRTHCRVYVSDNSVYVEDLHSSNGTWINDEIKLGQQRVRIGVGDTLSLAGQGVFQIVEASSTVTASPVAIQESEPEKPKEHMPEPPASSVKQNGRPAGFWRRCGAWMIDYILVNIVTFLISVLVLLLMDSNEKWTIDNQTANMVFTILSLLFSWLYWAAMESSVKQATLGKAAFEMIVTDMAGQRISFVRATGRHFAKFLSALIVGIGFLMVGFTDNKQALHDQISGCFVVKKNYMG